MDAKLLHNCQILTMLDSTILQGGAVGVVGERIALVSQDQAEIERFKSENPHCEVVDCGGRLIMPGLINTHTHTSMTLMRNLYEDMELMTWLNDHVWPFEAQIGEDDIEAGSRLSIAEMLLGGTTTFVDMYFSMSRVAKAVESMGIRALLTETLIVGREESFLANLSELVDAVKGSTLLSAGVAPHAPYTIPPQSAKVAAQAAQKYNLPINTHLWETIAEPDMVGRNPVEYFAECGFLSPTTIAAHCVHLDSDAIETMKSCGCTVSHCPESNMKLASGVAPLVEMHRAGVRCTIGTDGVCSNNDLDMWGEMRSAALLQRVATLDPVAITAFEILRMATVNGACAVGHEGELGIIKEGALADIIMVDTLRPHHRPNHNLISSLVFCAQPSDVVMTMVAGKILVMDGQLLHHDVEAISADVERRAEECLSRLSSK